MFITVSKQLNRMSEISAHNLHSLSATGINKTMFEIALKRFGKYLKQLDLNGFKIEEDTINIIAEECPNLKEVNLGDSIKKMCKSVFENALKKFGGYLEQIDLEGFEGDDNTMNIVATECPNLRVIDLGSNELTKASIEALKPNFNKVETFRFSIAEEDIDEDLKNLFLLNKKLKAVEIKSLLFDGLYNLTYSKISGSVMQALPQESLVCLKLDRVHVNDTNFTCGLRSLEMLTLIDLALKNDDLVGIASNCLDLKSITLQCKY